VANLDTAGGWVLVLSAHDLMAFLLRERRADGAAQALGGVLSSNQVQYIISEEKASYRLVIQAWAVQ